MAQPVIQTSFHAGEWAPALNARVDLAKYHSAAALLLNFFVDYRGGASTRTGTKYILQAFKSSTAVRLIPFQASFTVGYILEFGNQYIRFFNNGAAVLEATTAITGATQANPGIIHDVAHGYMTGDWIYILNVVGMTQLNGNYYIVVKTDADHYTLTDLNGVAINTTAYTAYISGGTAQRVYTLPSPYLSTDLSLVKFAQNVNTLILVHPSYPPFVLTLISATNWTLVPIVFGTTVGTPGTVVTTTTLGAGNVNYAYVVTAVDVNGQESGPSAYSVLAAKLDLRTTAGTNNTTWAAVTGAVSYNVYKAELSYTGAVPGGAAFGFIGNCTGLSFADSNIAPDFSLTPPIPENPFQGAGLASATVTVAGAYTTVPIAVVDNAPAGGATATVQPVLGITVAVPFNNTTGTTVGTFLVQRNDPNANGGPILQVATVDGSGNPLTYNIISPGAISSGATPANPVLWQTSPFVVGFLANITLTWGVKQVQVVNAGAGYVAVPNITFSAGIAAATAVLAASSAGNPSAVGLFDQRLVLAAPTAAVQTFYMSQPGSYYNYNISNPIEADDAITGSIVSSSLNEIQSMVAVPAGLAMLTSGGFWIVNGGSSGAPVSAISTSASAQSYIGASEVPPIVSNFDILFVQAKGSIVRDVSYNFYANIFTGTDISVLSSHLFYGHTILEWAWAEEPFKLVYAVRDDGVMLTLTFLKEQELIGWAHSNTQGLYKSVAKITEAGTTTLDAVYTVVQRTINGNTVQYIERFAERIFPNGMVDAWCVDAGLQYNGAPATSFTGGQHLAGATVVGLADGIPVTPFVMPTNGSFTLPAPASKVTIGLGFTPQLQTLAIDTGDPTIQGKMKVIPAVTLRVQDTLGLSIGSTFQTLVNMQDLTLGKVGSATNTVVTDLVTGDAKSVIDARYTTPGQYCIQQSNPLPATILGVMPELSVGDTK